MTDMDGIGKLRNYVAHALPSPQVRRGKRHLPRKVSSVILFGRHPNPTTDYYFSARLAAPGMPPYRLVDIREKDLRDLDPDGAFVIVCRYASASVLDWIEASGDRLAGVGLFLDDDIAAGIASRESSIRYKLSLLVNAVLPLRRLNRQLDVVWVSTPRLAQALSHAQPRILPPAPPESLWNFEGPVPPASEKQTVSIAYHATGIHVQEHQFLRPIIADVLSMRPQASFEVFADRRTAHLWHDMAQVIVRKPVPWLDYARQGGTRRIDIMLVPLAPSPVNDCRSSTKRIDVARLGAAGIFSISEAYGDADGSGEFRIPYSPETWRQTIIDLIDHPSRRAAAADATRSIVRQMTANADSGIDLAIR
jgi:hypothetical protein